MNDYYVAIMAGGIGSRFWPKSRESLPKQFLDILGTGKTLIQATYERFTKLIPEENIFIVTGENYSSLVKEQLPNIKDEQILEETARRNTAPCIAYMAYKLSKKAPNATFVVAPSDHLITETETFLTVIKKALDHAAIYDTMVTLGIKPHNPHTGYGYIQFDEDTGEDNIYKVKTFTEKPKLSMAKAFVKSGDFLWNSGIFIWNVRTIINAFKQHQPDIHDLFTESLPSLNGPDEKKVIRKLYASSPSISIDYGIMEAADNVSVIPSSFGWSDLGTWTSLWEKHQKDYLGNAIEGNALIYGAENCMIMAPENKLVIVQGLQDYLVVDSKDVLLICQLEKQQHIKDYNDDAKRRNGKLFS